MKTVTALVAQQKNKKRVNVYLDGEFFMGLDLFVVMKERLKVGEAVDEKRLAEIAEESEYSSALEKTLERLSKRMLTKKQIITYLKERNYSGRVIARVIDRLTDYGYVDDAAFAEKYYREKSAFSGKYKIAFELKTKGVDEKIIENIAESAGDSGEACRRVAEKYIKGRPVDFELKQKCYRYLISKGFEYDVAKSVLDGLSDEDSYS